MRQCNIKLITLDDAEQYRHKCRYLRPGKEIREISSSSFLLLLPPTPPLTRPTHTIFSSPWHPRRTLLLGWLLRPRKSLRPSRSLSITPPTKSHRILRSTPNSAAGMPHLYSSWFWLRSSAFFALACSMP